jgi:hypothetical protein
VAFGLSTAGLPNGTVNRAPYNGQQLVSKDNWASAVAAQLALPPVVYLKPAVTYNSSTRQANISVFVEYVAEGSSSDFLAVYFSEDSIIAPQKDYAQRSTYPNGHVPNYVHRHLFRGTVNNSPWGERITSSTPTAGTKITKNYTWTVPAGFDPSKIHVVAFVHNNTTKQIYNVNSTHLK